MSDVVFDQKLVDELKNLKIPEPFIEVLKENWVLMDRQTLIDTPRETLEGLIPAGLVTKITTHFLSPQDEDEDWLEKLGVTDELETKVALFKQRLDEIAKNFQPGVKNKWFKVVEQMGEVIVQKQRLGRLDNLLLLDLGKKYSPHAQAAYWEELLEGLPPLELGELFSFEGDDFQVYPLQYNPAPKMVDLCPLTLKPLRGGVGHGNIIWVAPEGSVPLEVRQMFAAAVQLGTINPDDPRHIIEVAEAVNDNDNDKGEVLKVALEDFKRDRIFKAAYVLVKTGQAPAVQKEEAQKGDPFR